MKNILITFMLLALSFGSACAQSLSATDQKAIDEAMALGQTAFQKMDISILTPLMSENVEQIVPDGTIVRGKANVSAGIGGYMSYLKTQPKPDRFESKKSSEQYRYLMPDLVLYTFSEVNTSYFGDKTTVEKMSEAMILHKINGKWLVELIALTPLTK
ncbi:MAG: hypothetical protein WCR52_12195 [Bacteroidota bacterium]